jgi:tetratricopeptide (TPR) repeat protein
MAAYFDPKDKNNKPVLDFFFNKTWMVIESSSSARVSIKKTLTQIGAQMSNIYDAYQISDAEVMIFMQKPNFIITNRIVGGESALNLFSVHLSACPNRLKSGFFVIAEEKSVSDVAWTLEYEMDGIIPLPLNGMMLIQTILDGVKRKVAPDKYTFKLEEGRHNYLSNDLDKAVEHFKEAIHLEEKPFETHALLGQIYSDKKLTKEAIASFEESVKHNDKYFKSLNRLSKLYYQEKDFEKSYDVTRLIAESFPVSPEKIPELIRLSIINKKYEDILKYFKTFQSIKNPSLEMQNYLSAALAILGKYFVSTKDNEKALLALKDAFKYSNGKYEIIKSITLSYQELNKADVLFALYDRVDLNLWPKQVQGLYFYSFHLSSADDTRVIQEGEKLLKNRIFDPFIYKGLIERNIKLKRKKSIIEDLVHEGCKNFPELTRVYENLLKSYN